MEFAVMPDHLYGASVRVNGKWIGYVDGDQPLLFRMNGQGTFEMLVELTPLRSDPTNDVHPIPFARLVRVKNSEIVPPETETDGALHLRKNDSRMQLHFVYPKADALGRCLDTLPLTLQTETADFDRDGRLDSVETFATSSCGYVRIRTATGTILLNEAFPDSQLHVELADLNRDGRPDVLIFWVEPTATNDGTDGARMQMWNAATGAVEAYDGFTGVRRQGRGGALLERKKQTPFRQVIELYEYVPREHESPTFPFVRAEEKWLQRADTPEETIEAVLSSWEIGDSVGVAAYLAKGVSVRDIERLLKHVYAHTIIGKSEGGSANTYLVHAYDWIVPGYYDRERHLDVELIQQPDRASEWKISRVYERDTDSLRYKL